MRKLLFILVTTFFTSLLFGQQQAVFSNIINAPMQYSAAYAGSTNYHELAALNRYQWVGFENAPKNVYLNFQGSYQNKAKHGYGFSLQNERAGILSKTALYANYAYQLKLNKKWKLGLGVRPGYLQYGIRFYDAVIADNGDEVLEGNSFVGSAFDLGTGFRMFSDKWEFGANVSQILSNGIRFTSYNQNLVWHSSLFISYVKKFKNNWELKPMLLFRFVQPVPSQMSFSIQGKFKNQWLVNLNFRTDDAVGLGLGYVLKNRLTLFYAYDFSYSPIRKYNAGSHEIGLNFILTKKRPSLEEEDDKLNNSILEQINKQIEEEKKEK